MTDHTGPSINRTDQAAFLASLREFLGRCAGSDTGVGLLVMQIEQFDRINARFGYRGGDQVLVEIAVRLQEGFDARARVARIGSRKFAVALPGLQKEGHALLAAKKVERLVERPMQINGHLQTIRVVQGAALFPEHAASEAELLQRAEMAMAVARETGSGIEVYSSQSSSEMTGRWHLERELHRMLDDGGIEVYFQPKLDLARNAIAGAEALLRGKDSSGEPVSPEVLVALAEHTDRIVDLTANVLNATLRHLSEWTEQGYRIGAAVNMTPDLANHPDFANLVTDALGVWCAPPELLTLEVTESAFMSAPESTFRILTELRMRGVRISIDDFGTGHSSLAYFKHIPANELKIDQRFIAGMMTDPADHQIVEAIIELAHRFGLDVVAEGVAEEPMLDKVRKLGCQYAQGYFIGRPMHAAEFVQWLGAQSVANAGA